MNRKGVRTFSRVSVLSIGALLLASIGTLGFSTGVFSFESTIAAASEAFVSDKADQTERSSGIQSVPRGDDNGADVATSFGANERFVFGQGDLPLLFTQRIDKIYSLASNGTRQDVGSINDFEPSWSPDGKKIVFISLRDGPTNGNYQTRQQQREIYTMNADGSDQERLGGSFFGGESQPSYSFHTNPSQQRIVYVADYSPGGGPTGIFTRLIFGSSETQLDTDPCFEEERRKGKPGKVAPERSQFFPGIYGFDTPNYSPNNNFIIFGADGENGRNVYRIGADGTGCTLLYEGEGSYGPTQARYSPDGTKIVLFHEELIFGGLNKQELTGLKKLRVLDANTGAVIDDIKPTDLGGWPVWSPDGTHIAYFTEGSDPETGDELSNLGIRSVRLSDGFEEIIYQQGVPEGLRGMSWGIPSSVVPAMSMRINSPHPLTSGGSTTGTIYLASPAPAGGSTISLTALGAVGAMTVPSSLFIPEGQTQGIFTINSAVSTFYRGGGVLATRTSPFAQAEASVSLHPSRPDLSAVSLTAQANTAPGVSFPVSWTVSNVGPVATGSNGGSDVVYFSIDNILDAGDGPGIRTIDNPSPLAPGASRTINSTATIPASLVPASGDYFLILGTNPNEAINEGGQTANNTFAVPVHVDLPDLVVENLNVPAVVEPGISYNISWTMRNAGSAPTVSTFTKGLYFSTDSIAGNSDDLLIDTMSNAAMAAGASAAQSTNATIPTVPARASSAAFFYVQADTQNTVNEGFGGGLGETNNITFQPTQFSYRVSDLQVTSTSSPVEVETETAFAMEWTSANTGNRDAPTFSDRVFFSTDAAVGGDIQIGSFTLTGGLAEGASVNRIQNVTIPTSAISATGNYWVYVRTDGGSNIDEGENENNNIRFHPLTVRRLLRPDLTVSNITAPPAAFFGQTIQVQWTVTNNGPGPTNASSWKDRVNINTTGANSSPTKVIDVESISALNTGESYVASATVKVPRGLNGSFLVVVTTDITGTLNEETSANNKLTRAITLNIPPLPDLTVSNVVAPEQAFAGGPLNVSWQVNNIGDAAAVDDNEEDGSSWQWKDRVYLSRDQVLNTSQDRLIFTSGVRSSPLAPGASFSRNTFVNALPAGDYVKLPADLSGEYYVFAITDVSNSIYEFNSENNNHNFDQTQPGSPINVLVTPSDLVILNAPTANAAASGGQVIDVSFTVKNQGAFATGAAWTNGLYLSADQTYDAGDTLLGSKAITSLAPGAERLLEMSVQLPNCITGNRYLIARADTQNKVAEFDPGYDAEANNASPAHTLVMTSPPIDLQATSVQHSPVTTPGQTINVSWTETNNGTGPSPSQWVDRILLKSTEGLDLVEIGRVTQNGSLGAGQSAARNANVNLPAFMQGQYVISIQTDYNRVITECGTGEDNNTTDSDTFNVNNNLPDLIVDTVVAPTTPVTAGQDFVVEWTGRNAGATTVDGDPGWIDRVYLSTDANLSNSDRSLGTVTVTTALTTGQTYQKQLTVNSGNVSAGQYYILIVADSGTDVYEGPSGSSFETNNLQTSDPITIGSPNVDLQTVVNAVGTPTYSGTSIPVTWTVTNAGTTPTLGNTWTDYIILSRDSVLDSTDKTLGYLAHEEVLAGGANYQQTKSVSIPSGLTGLYRIFVIADYKNKIVENNEINNRSQSFDVNLELAPPADLNITNIVVPAGQTPGEVSSFEWTVQNTGSFPAIGPWRDSVYLSRDQFWDPSDYLMGQRERTGTPLAVSQTEVATRGFQIPFIEEGNYYVIVRLDSQNRVRENNEANNVSISVSQMPITVQTLALNTPFATTLNNGGQKSFKFDTPENETVIVSLFGQPGNSNELFTNFFSAASRADYDFQSSGNPVPNQENFIQNTEEGRYYSFVSHDYIQQDLAEGFAKAGNQIGTTPVPPQNITVSANVIPFSIQSFSPTSAGNAGLSSLMIKGAKFAPGATVKLVAPNGSEVMPAVSNVSSSVIRVLFDLKGKSAGQYDLVVTNPDGQSTSIENGFTVVAGGGHSLGSSVRGPQSLRIGTTRPRYTFTAGNDGINDAQAVPFVISLPAGMGYDIDPLNYLEFPSEMLPAGTTATDAALHVDIDGRRYVLLILPLVPARSTVNISINLHLPNFSGYQIGYGIMPPFPEMVGLTNPPLSTVSNFSQLTVIPGRAVPTVDMGNVSDCFIEAMRQLFFLILDIIPGVNCLDEAVNIAADTSNLLTGAAWAANSGTFDATSVATGLLGYGLSVAKNVAECAGKNIPPLKLAVLAWNIGNLIKQILDCIGQFYLAVTFPPSIDPNEKIGPNGYGPDRFVGINEPMLYRINFENLPAAEAPAQRVFISDELPPTLDPRTVRLKEIGFKQNNIVIPENQAFYQARIQLGEDLNNLYADISAGLDIVNRRITWTITAIDPQTGERPLDPLVGLLPPNNAAFDGEGFVTFTVEPFSNSPNRTAITNKATIVFDENEAIVTNTTSNLLDSVVPTSVISPLLATASDPSVPITWTGTDDTDGSGTKGCEIRVSEDDGGFLAALTSTDLTGSAIFEGKWGKKYKLFSICSDNAGNVEAPPTTPDAEITILGGDTEGDVASRPNGNDGVVSVADLTQVRRFAAGLDTDFLYNEFQRADTAPISAGGDGGLSTADVIQSRRFAAGLDAPAEAFGPNEAIEFSAGVTVKGNSVAGLTRDIRPAWVRRVGNKLTVAVDLQAQGDEVGAGFTLNFATTKLTNPSNIVLGPDAGVASVTVNDSQAGQGRLGIIIDKSPTDPIPAGSKRLVLVDFDVVPGAIGTTDIGFGNIPIRQEVVNGTASPLLTTFTTVAIPIAVPTAANVNISGRVTDATSVLPNATVTLTDSRGSARTVRTNSFGYFRFSGVEVGGTYIVEVRSKQYVFSPRTVRVIDEIVDLDFSPD